MKKRYLSLICFALFFFLGICFMSVKKAAAFLYPTPEQFADIISRSGLEQWTLKDAGTELEGSAESIYSEARRYELCNQGQRICCQFLLYRSHVETIGLNIHFLPENGIRLTEQEYNYFLERELPEIWRLASDLCSDPQAASGLQEQIQAGYRQVIEPEQYSGRLSWFSEWGAQRSGIYATARVVKQDAGSQPMWYQIRLTDEAEYNAGPAPGQWELSESAMLSQAESEKNQEGGGREERRKTYFLYGMLSRIEGAGDFRLRFSPSSSNLPANMSFYQKAVLTDEKGSIPVYIAPTALSQEELLSRRLHIVQAVQNANHETCYVITQSSLIK